MKKAKSFFHHHHDDDDFFTLLNFVTNPNWPKKECRFHVQLFFSFNSHLTYSTQKKDYSHDDDDDDYYPLGGGISLFVYMS